MSHSARRGSPTRCKTTPDQTTTTAQKTKTNRKHNGLPTYITRIYMKNLHFFLTIHDRHNWSLFQPFSTQAYLNLNCETTYTACMPPTASSLELRPRKSNASCSKRPRGPARNTRIAGSGWVSCKLHDALGSPEIRETRRKFILPRPSPCAPYSRRLTAGRALFVM